MKNVTYIIPLHEYNDTVAEYLGKAYESLKPNLQKGDVVAFVGPQAVIDKAAEPFNTGKTKAVKLFYNEEKTDFFSQVNKAVMFCTTDFFSVLEYDDEYLPNWGVNGRLYSGNGASIVLPIAVIKDAKGILQDRYCNEIALSTIFKQDAYDKAEDRELDNEILPIGFVTKKGLDAYMDFQVTGGFIKTEDFIAIGGLKPSLKVAAWYEFLLRCVYNKKRIYVAPKLGYRHLVGREGSYTDTAYKEIGQEVGAWFIETARQEYFFKEDRNKVFGKEE